MRGTAGHQQCLPHDAVPLVCRRDHMTSVSERWSRGRETGAWGSNPAGSPTWSQSKCAGCSCGFGKELGQETLEIVSYKGSQPFTKHVLLSKALGQPPQRKETVFVLKRIIYSRGSEGR